MAMWQSQAWKTALCPRGNTWLASSWIGPEIPTKRNSKRIGILIESRCKDFPILQVLPFLNPFLTFLNCWNMKQRELWTKGTPWGVKGKSAPRRESKNVSGTARRSEKGSCFDKVSGQKTKNLKDSSWMCRLPIFVGYNYKILQV